jgi:hypothetical protein
MRIADRQWDFWAIHEGATKMSVALRLSGTHEATTCR